MDLPGGSMDGSLPVNAGDTGLFLVWEDSACHRAMKPVRHNFWAHALEPLSHNYWAHVLQLKPAHLEKLPQREATTMRSPRPAAIAAVGESLCAVMKTQYNQNIKK